MFDRSNQRQRFVGRKLARNVPIQGCSQYVHISEGISQYIVRERTAKRIEDTHIDAIAPGRPHAASPVHLRMISLLTAAARA